MPDVDSKLEFRGSGRDTMGEEEFERKEARYKRLWSARLGPQIAVLPRFD